MSKLHVELNLLYSIDDLKNEESMDDEECYLGYIHEKECEFKQNIENAILKEASEFEDHMGEVIAQYDMRGSYYTGTLEVNHVNISLPSGLGSVHVKYDYEVYSGCRDNNLDSDIDDDWYFQIEGNKVIFDLAIPERDDEI
jgi:hypothetical protein